MRVRGALVSAALCGFFCSSYAQGLPRPNQGSADGRRRVAVVAGKVFSAETGLGLPKATVALYSMENRQGARPLAAKTNEKGEYQFLRVPPGRYRMLATRNGYVRQAYGRNRDIGGLSSGAPIVTRPGQILGNVDFHLIPGAVIEGQILDNDYEPLSHVRVSLGRVRTIGGKRTLASVVKGRTDDRGIYRLFDIPPGSYYLTATYRPFAVPEGDDATPVPTYYPGVSNPHEATKIDIPPSARYTGVDMALREARSYSLSGTVIDADGVPLTSVRVYCHKQAGEGWASERAGGGNTDQAGNFEVVNLVPGDYLLSANGKRGGRTLMGSTTFIVTDKDVQGVVLTVGDGAEIRGKVMVEGHDEDLDPYRMSLQVVPEEIIPPVFRERKAGIKKDWTFRTTRIPPGSARLAVALPEGNYYVKSIRLRGMEVVDRAFTVSGSDRIRGVEVVVSPEGAQLAGVVEDDDTGEAAPGATVLIFSSNRAKRKAHSRFTRTTQTDQDGNFSISGIVPGEYTVCAVINHEAGAEHDSSYLSAMEKSCERVELARNQMQTETLVAVTLASYQ